MNRAVACSLVFSLAAAIASPGAAVDHPVVAALGGSRALTEVRTLSYTLEVVDLASGRTLTSRQFLDFTHRRLHRHDSKDGVESFRASNGVEGWRKDASGLRALDEAEARELVVSMHYNFFFLFSRPETRLVPISATADGAPRYRVEAPGLVEPFTVTTDAEGRVSELEFKNGMRGREFDWRPVAGLRWPFQYEINQDGRARRGTFRDFVVNPPLPSSLFAGLPPRWTPSP